MLNPVNKAICRTFLCALAFTSFAGAQIVERSRTLADLLQSHPCNSGLAGRHTIVTDCDAADDLGNGGGAFSCFARCDGVDTWAAVSIGGGAGGGGEATSVQGSATLPATCTELDLYQDTDSGGTEFYICTATNTWTKAGTGDGTIGGTLGATDNVAVCADGTGGVTAGACTGQALFPDGTNAAPGVSFSGDVDTGLYRIASNALGLSIGGTLRFQFDGNALYTFGGSIAGQGLTLLAGYRATVTASTAGSGAPLAVTGDASLGVETNEGATARNYRTLLTAASGHQPRFCVQDADGIRIVANTGDTIRVIDKVTAAAGYIESTTIGSCVSLVAINATEWFAISITGTWTDGTFTYDDTSLTTP